MKEFKNRGEQIDFCIQWALDNNVYYGALKHMPNRINAAIMQTFLHLNCSGYQARVLRRAKYDLDHCKLNLEMPEYSHEELYE